MTIHSARVRYESWLQDPQIDEATKEELYTIANQPEEIEERFYCDLAFGTGGLRGVIGAGTNRMNRYTVGKATQGLAQYLLQHGESKSTLSVVIAYDSRHQSPEFALETALVLAANGIRAYVFESLRSTPQCSFAVRHLQADAGIVITASHNPPEYNGYKVYNATGGQLVPYEAERVIEAIQELTSFAAVKRVTRSEAEATELLQWIGAEVDEAFINAVTSVSVNPDVARHMADHFRIVYTPLHGTGNIPVRAALDKVGFTQVKTVIAQERPDANFSTVKSPNPEDKEAFQLAIETARGWDADIIVGTDPDCDRMGALVQDQSGEYVVLTGNQTGAILTHYILQSKQKQGKLPSDAVIVKTIVTSELGASIAAHYGVDVLNTLTGFKYIGEKMTEFERQGSGTFLFGYEESYGYLAGTHARDKDAVVASMLICEAAAYYKGEGKTLQDVLRELYTQHGYFVEHLESITLQGLDGAARIQSIMHTWREQPPTHIAGVAIRKVEDFSQGLYGLPRENVLKYTLEDDAWFCLRPSGTEPKIKLYFAVHESTDAAAGAALDRLVQDVMVRVDPSSVRGVTK